MIVIDKLCYRSKLRYVNAGEKFAFSLLTPLFCIISRSIVMAVLVLLVNSFLTVKKGGIPLGRYLKLMMVPFAFLLLSTLTILVNISKTPLDAFAIPAGSWFLTGSFASIQWGTQLILTAIASVSCLYFLSLNTPVTDILGVLEKLHCPLLFMELMLLIYRFIFILSDTASAITTSQHARLGNKDYRTSLRSFGTLCSTLFIRAMKQSEEVYTAMEARCYNGTIHVLNENKPPRKREIFYMILFELLLLALTLTAGFRPVN